MTPYEFVKANFDLPVDLYPFQVEAVNKLATLERAGYYLSVGCGKTITTIAASLYKLGKKHVKTVVCLMPPILITNWERTLTKIPGVSVTAYRGTPKKRAELDLSADFVLMSYQIFKADWDKLHAYYQLDTVCLLCDEATSLKNIASATYKAVRDFTTTNHIMLLTGTPLSTPIDGYAYVKTISPGIYRNLHQFEQIHVEERDFFKKPTKWANLDLLKENLEHNSARVLKEDALKDLPPVTYTEMFYDLSPAHLKLYQQLASEQLKVLDNGDKIDITNVSALFNALQQIPANSEHFSGGEVDSTIFDLIDEIMDELGNEKLVLFTRYRMTNKRVEEKCAKYGVRVIYGGVSAKQQQDSIDTFVNDPSCRMIALQVQAAGFGVDSLQSVCKDALFIELPYTAAAFEQAEARLHRGGQKGNVNIRIALAEKTIQNYIWQMVQGKSALVNLCIRGSTALQDSVFGVTSRQPA